jgi:hypothetical protein
MTVSRPGAYTTGGRLTKLGIEEPAGAAKILRLSFAVRVDDGLTWK